MRTKFVGIVAAALLAVAAFGTASASAATEFGDNCSATVIETAEPVTLFDLAAAGNTLPVSAPSAGIITKWTVSSAVPTVTTLTLKVLRPNAANTVQTLAEATQAIGAGQNISDARIPVQAGDRLALFGEKMAALCQTAEKNLIGGFPGGGGGIGSTNPFVEVPAEARIPVSATLEPDADNDGYGDETQDKCPQNAAVQAACPPPPMVPLIALSTSSIVKSGLVTVLVTSSSQAPVTVTGTVKLGKGQTAKLNGGTQVVAPTAIARFTLPFTKPLRSKLKQLSAKRTLALNIVATATNTAGQPSSTKLKAKLKGQAKPKHKGRPKAKAHA